MTVMSAPIIIIVIMMKNAKQILALLGVQGWNALQAFAIPIDVYHPETVLDAL